MRSSTFLAGAAIALALALGPARSVSSQRMPPRSTSALVNGVRISGMAHASSTGVDRSPEYTFRNRTSEVRVVELVALITLGGSSRQALPIVGPRRIELGPRRVRAMRIDFRGTPLQSAAGLSYHRFLLQVRVGDEKGNAVASNSYMCRIPLRRDVE